jgi:hypothetical protein
MDLLATTATTGLGIGLLVTALLLGLRHGVDWDHIAAITDLSATQDSPRRGMVLGTLYAIGHGIVVLAIGTVAIVAGRNLPESIDALFGRIVGWSLIILGVYVIWSLAVHRGGFRMQSRWMLLIRSAPGCPERNRSPTRTHTPPWRVSITRTGTRPTTTGVCTTTRTSTVVCSPTTSRRRPRWGWGCSTASVPRPPLRY